MTTMLLLVVLSADVSDVPNGLKDPQKWLAAKERRETAEAYRSQLAKSIRANKHYQEMLDRNERIKYYNDGGCVHPAFVNQVVMSQLQSAVYAETLYRTIYPWSNRSNQYQNGYNSGFTGFAVTGNVFVRRNHGFFR